MSVTEPVTGYQILYAANREGLIKKVMAELAAGWQLYKAPFGDIGVGFYQTVVSRGSGSAYAISRRIEGVRTLMQALLEAEAFKPPELAVQIATVAFSLEEALLNTQKAEAPSE